MGEWEKKSVCAWSAPRGKKRKEGKYPWSSWRLLRQGGGWPHTHDTTHTNTNPTRQGSPPDGETYAILRNPHS